LEIHSPNFTSEIKEWTLEYKIRRAEYIIGLTGATGGTFTLIYGS